MILLYALLIGSHDAYHWNLSCPDYQQARISVLLDEEIEQQDKYNIISYLETKLVEDCSEQTFG